MHEEYTKTNSEETLASLTTSMLLCEASMLRAEKARAEAECLQMACEVNGTGDCVPVTVFLIACWGYVAC